MGGVAVGGDGVGGDATCDPVVDQEEDAIVFRLPEAYRPAKNELHGVSTVVMIIVGKNQLVTPEITLPAGSVYVSPSGGGNPAAVLDGITFRTDSAGGGGAAAPASPSRVDASARRALSRLLNL
jgi:hypothetical protein